MNISSGEKFTVDVDFLVRPPISLTQMFVTSQVCQIVYKVININESMILTGEL